MMGEVLELQEGNGKEGRKMCLALNLRGEPCRSWVVTGTDFCFVHNPANAEERLAAVKLGGVHNRAKHSPRVNIGTIPGKIRTIEDLLELLDYCKDEFLFLSNSLNRNKAIVQLCSTYSQILKDADMVDRLDDLYDEVQGLLAKAQAKRQR